MPKTEIPGAAVADAGLFAALQATWPPAETRAFGPWTLRRGEGGGGRVSAASLDGPMADPMADPREAAAAMREMGQLPLFRVREGQDELDRALAGLGYAVRGPTVLLAAPAAEVAFSRPDVVTIDCEGPLAALAELWAEEGVGPARLRVMARVAAPKLYLLGRLDDRPAGAGFVALHEGVAMLHALAVAPWARRRRLGARLSQAAASWGLAQGATTFALAVERANAPGRALYAALGLAELGGYHYRAAPEEEMP